MVLESNEPSNLKKLVLKEPTEVIPYVFIPENHISGDDWGKIKDRLAENRSDFEKAISKVSTEEYAFNLLSKYLSTALAAKVLFPDRFFELGIDDNFRSTLLHYCENSTNPLFYFHYAKLLFPDDVKSDDMVPYQEDMDNRLIPIRNQKDGYALASWLRDFKIFFPESSPAEFINDDEKKIIIDKVEKYKKWPKWITFGQMVVGIRIAVPELFKEIKIEQSDWEAMENKLYQYRQQGEWEYFAQLASSMTQMTAQKLTVTDEGLSLKLHANNSKGESAKIPEVRKF